MSKNLPIIFILDMDKCIIGNSIYLLDYQRLIDYLKSNCKQKNINGNICDIDEKIWKKNISPHFIRPFLKEFIFTIKELFDNVEFFIFSAGTKLYVEKTIEYIEETINFKFNRPLFTREDTLITTDDSMIKEINGFKDIIIKSLHSKYQKTDIDLIFKNRLIIIDDIKKFWENSQLIICNPYNYTPIPYLDYSLLNEIRNYKEILDYIIYVGNSLFPSYISSSKNFDDFYLNYHLHTSEILRNNLHVNNEAIKDKFFKNLLKLLKPRLKLKNPFTSKFISSLNKKMIQ